MASIDHSRGRERPNGAGATSSALQPTRANLLEEDPSLARWLSPAEAANARERAVVPVLRLTAGVWRPPKPEGCGRPGHLGFLVLDGLLSRDEILAGHASTQIVGPGDLIQPWTLDAENALVPREVIWTVAGRARLAVLGPAFLAAIWPWPQLRNALLERALLRCARISTHLALSQLSRVDARLLVLFWHLAERFGRVSADGLLLELRLSHEALGRLAGAKRPTVSLALRRLEAEGLIARRVDRTWVLRGSVAEALERLEVGEAASRPPLASIV